MSEWIESEIKEIGKVVSGGTPNTSNTEYWNGDVLFVTPNDLSKLGNAHILNTERKITEEGFQNSSANKLPVGSLVISSRAPIGYVGIAEFELTTNQGCKSIIPFDIFSSEYLYYSIIYYVERLKRLGAGSTFAEISKSDLEKVKLPHPKEKSEQRQIAQILTTSDAVIEKTQAAIAKYKAIKQGMLQDLFTRGIDLATGKLRPKYEDAPDLYKESKLGMVPKDWEVECLEDLCFEKPTYGINAAAVEFSYQLPTYIRITDIDEDGNFIKKGRKCVNSPLSNQYYLKKGDIVFARTGATVGKTYLFNEADGLLVYAGFLIKVAPEKNLLDFQFLKFLTETPYYMNWVEIMSQRSGQPGINGNEYGSFLVPKPKMPEQEMISKRLLTIQNKLQAEQNYLQKLQSIKQGLMGDLLSGKKTVNLT